MHGLGVGSSPDQKLPVDLTQTRSKLQESAAAKTSRAPPKPPQHLSKLAGALSTGYVAKCDHDGVFTVRAWLGIKGQLPRSCQQCLLLVNF